jgi:hypothetical protein
MATIDPPAPPVSLAAIPVADVAPCPSCGAAMGGEYCPACGEKRVREEHFSIRHFLREVGAEVFDLDSRALRSVKTLLFSPGTLTLEYLSGRRRAYLGPLRMFLAVFALVLFTGTLLPVNPASRQRQDATAARFHQLVHAVAVHRGLGEPRALEALVDASAQAESWLAVFIPLLFAGVVYACFRRRRRWYGEHLVFATHFATFNYVFALVLLPLALLVPVRGMTLPILLVTYTAMLAYLAIAVRRVYGGGKAAAGAWAFGLLLAFGIVQGVIGLASLCVAVARLEWF